MKRICTGAYFDICQNCKYVCTRSSVVGSEFDTLLPCKLEASQGVGI